MGDSGLGLGATRLVHVRPAGPGARSRATSAALAIAIQVGFIILWIVETHVDAPKGRRGSGVVEMRLWSMAGSPSVQAIHPDARRSAPTPRPRITLPAPKKEAIDLDQPWIPLPVPVEKKEEPVKREPERYPEMSSRDADEFRRQWAQLQSEVEKKALDNAGRPDVPPDLRAANTPFQKFSAAPPGPSEDDRKNAAARRRSSDDSSMFAGELCVSRAGPEGQIVLAMPCIGDNYVTDYGWQGRVHAPERGDPLPGSVDPTGRVVVRNHQFSQEVLEAFADAQSQLYRIQVTMRMVYLPELKDPIQLLSRDDRAGAISAQAFHNEHELAAYLAEWAENVRRWKAQEERASRAPAPATAPDAPRP